jgi:enhancing lycopene biosynthesis protein 2
MRDVFVATLVKVITGAAVSRKQAALFEVAHIGSGHRRMVSQHLGADQTGTALLSGGGFHRLGALSGRDISHRQASYRAAMITAFARTRRARLRFYAFVP